MLNRTPTAALARCATQTRTGLPHQGRSVSRAPGAAQAVAAGSDPLPFGSFLRGWVGHEGCGLTPFRGPEP